MAKQKNPAPDKHLKDLLHVGDDGLFYWVDTPENYRRLKLTKGEALGKGCNGDYPKVRYKDIFYSLHKLMYWYYTDKWPDMLDHIDRDKTNYKFDNLRETDPASNKINTKSTYSITTYTKKDGSKSFYVRVFIDGTHYSLDAFDNELTALYAAWKIRDLLYPGFCPVPEQIKQYI
ncbi:TPA: hypothetical protein QH056_001836 [Klebsiella oxytoca]|nr:hypothetical protein [Klebsiella oxytoca]